MSEEMKGNSKEYDGFVRQWLDDIADDVRRYGPIKLVPIWYIFCYGAASVPAVFVPVNFWHDPAVVITFFGVFITLSGIVLAFAWSAFSKIYESLLSPKFAAFLQRADLVRTYRFFVAFYQYNLVFSIVVPIISIMVYFIFPHYIQAQRFAVALTMGSVLYSLKCANGAVTLMQDIVQYRIHFDINGANGRPTDSDSSVVSIKRE